MATAPSLGVEIYQVRRNLRKSLPCQCFEPWSLNRVYAFAWFFPARPLRSPTHGEGHLPGRRRHRGDLCGWLCLGDRWNAPIAHATQASLRTAIHKMLNMPAPRGIYERYIACHLQPAALMVCTLSYTGSYTTWLRRCTAAAGLLQQLL